MKIIGRLLKWILIFIGIVILAVTLINCITHLLLTHYIDSFSAVDMENQLTPEYDEDGTPYFVTDGELRILQLSDVHIGGGFLSFDKDKRALNAVAAMITAEKPDLVVITGDMAFAVPWSGTLNNYYGHRSVIRLMERLGVYWTVTFGNHEADVFNLLPRSAVARMYADDELSYCLFDRGPKEVFGEGNLVINLKNSQGIITQSLIMMDSNAYTLRDPLGIRWIYDNIHDDQIKWYEDQIKKYSEYNKALISSLPEADRADATEKYSTVKSLLFLHIPPREVRYAWDEFLSNDKKDTENVQYHGGKMNKPYPSVSCPMEDDGLFESVLAMGSTGAIFYGHDHDNNMVVSYKGVILSYNYSIDYFAYPGIDNMSAQRGCSIITVTSDGSFKIDHENYYSDKYVPLYEKEDLGYKGIYIHPN